jgi:peptide/nickel transport system substrate-binding protein
MSRRTSRRAVHAVGEHGLARPEHKKAPLNDPRSARRSPMRSTSADVDQQGLRRHRRPSQPDGPAPSWDKYVDKSVVASARPKYDPAKAKSILAAAGYKAGSDGFVTNKDGSPIKLTISVPTGWSDWEVARDIIISSLKAVGINTESKPLDYNGLVAARNSGDFDLLINNDVQIGNTPWNYYDYIFHMPLMTGAGEEPQLRRLREPDAWALVQQLDKTAVTDVATMQSIT